jgi:drug/metabolite transporter (DMT)-like permease
MRLVLPVIAGPTRHPLPLLVGAFCLLWSSAFPVAKLALRDCPPLLLLTARFLLAGVVMLGVAVAQGGSWRLARRDVFVLCGIGVANNALYLGFNYAGMRGVSAGLSALIVSANPVLTAVLAPFWLNERMSWRKAVGLLLGITGVAYIVAHRVASGLDSPIGIGLVIGGMAALVCGTILFKRLQPKGGLWIGNGMQNLAGGFALAPFAFAFEGIREITLSWQLCVALAYLVFMVSICGYLLWFHLLTVSGAISASAYHFLMPPLGLLFGWALLGEPAMATDLAGILPVAFGIYLVTRPAKAPYS